MTKHFSLFLCKLGGVDLKLLNQKLPHYMSHYSNCTSRWCTNHSGRTSSNDNPAKATSDEQCVASLHAEKTRNHSNNAQCSPRQLCSYHEPTRTRARLKQTETEPPLNRRPWYVCFGDRQSAIAAFTLATTNHTRAQSSIRPTCMAPRCGSCTGRRKNGSVYVCSANEVAHS